jgi:phosphinothricin acetyltransferase
MDISPMLPGHASRVLKIYQAGIDGGNATFETEVPSWERFFAGKLHDHCFVALEGERVVGWVTLTAYSAARSAYRGVAEESVYVHPEAQGRGIGRALLDTAITSSERAGFWTLLAGIFPENVGSIRLHEALGFRLIGIQERIGVHVFEGSTRFRDVARYERRSHHDDRSSRSREEARNSGSGSEG